MSDPAVEAAQRALNAQPQQLPWHRPEMEAAAHEALKPIRELHIRVRSFSWPEKGMCRSCQLAWPCATAKLIYPGSEL